MTIMLKLEVDKQLVDLAKNYASQQNQSLSQLIENYLTSLTFGEKTSSFSPKQSNLLRFANCIENEDLILMKKAIAQECEQVDTNEW